MSWQDVVINIDLDQDLLRTGLAKTFRVEPGLVNIIDEEIHDWFEDSYTYKIICAVAKVRGEFMTSLHIILMDKKLFPDDVLGTLGSLCHYLKCQAVTPYGNESLNPYLWTLIRGKDDYYEVQLDGDMLDAEKIGFSVANILNKILDQPSSRDEK